LCAGLLAQSLGLPAMFPDDHIMLQHGMLMYDAYCARIKLAHGETHDWKPAAARVSLDPIRSG